MPGAKKPDAKSEVDDISSAEMPKQSRKHINALLEESRRRISWQCILNQSLSNKALVGAVFAGGILLPVIDFKNFENLNSLNEMIILLCALFSFSIVVIIALNLYKSIIWEHPFNDMTDVSYEAIYSQKNSEEQENKILKGYASAIDYNTVELNRKARLLNYLIFIIILEVFFLSIFIIFQFTENSAICDFCDAKASWECPERC